MSNTKESFSSVIQHKKVLSRDQAIVVDTIQGLTVKEYALALTIAGFNETCQA